MDRGETVRGLAGFRGRAAGSDAERRAAIWLRDSVRSRGRAAELQALWVHPRWGMTYAWHATLALAGTLVAATADEGIGFALLALALVSLLADLWGRAHLLRRLTPRRATQNVVSTPPPDATSKPARLVIMASYDIPPSGLILRHTPRRWALAIEGLFGGHGPGMAGVLVGSITVLCALAAAGVAGAGAWTRPASLPFAVILVVAAFLLLDLGPARRSDAGMADASAVAVALALVDALTAAPPLQLAVELVLSGAGHSPALGARAWVRSQRGAPRERTVVLNVAPATAGPPRFTTREGVGFAIRFHAQLVGFCRRVASEEPRLGARGRVSRFPSGALPARLAGFPAITIGTAPSPATLEPSEAAMRGVLELGLALVDLVDEAVGQQLAPAGRG